MLGQLPNYWWTFSLLGVFAGIASGTLGLGGGVVVVPALVLLPFFAFEQKAAQGTALALMVPMALLGAFRYWRNPHIDVSLAVVVLIVLGALPGVLVGTELAARLPSHILRKFFAVFLVIVAVRMFIAPRKQVLEIPGGNLSNQDKASAVEPGGRNCEPTEQ